MNILNLVKAYLRVQDDVSEDLYIVGDYVNVQDVDNNALKLIKQSPRIKLLGQKSKNELIKYYNESKLYIHPSKYEGFGFPPIEAIACNCVVLAAGNSSIPEVCKDGATYFDPNNIAEISNLIKDTLCNNRISHKMIKNKQKIIELYHWENTSIKTIKLIKSIIR